MAAWGIQLEIPKNVLDEKRVHLRELLIDSESQMILSHKKLTIELQSQLYQLGRLRGKGHLKELMQVELQKLIKI